MAAAVALSLDADAVRILGFPVYSLHHAEKRDGLKKVLEYDHARLIQNGIVGQTMHGLALAWHYHPHAWSVRCGDMLTPLQVFGNHDLLHKALARRKKLGNCETDSDLRKAVRTYSGTQSVSNFRPTAAAAIYDRYLPEIGGVAWDMSAGFGGRLLGALACRKVKKYIGTDPATLTMDGLSEMRGDLLPMMQCLGHSVPQIDLHQIGSEDFTPEPESIDLCFTSPPYGPHERYSDEPTQSYIKFPTNEAWLDGFMKQTLDNCHVGLKPDGYLVVNIAGVKSHPILHDDFLSLAQANGWQLVETLKLALSKMPGTGKDTASHKWEPVYVFQKLSRPCVQFPSLIGNSAMKDGCGVLTKLLDQPQSVRTSHTIHNGSVLDVLPTLPDNHFAGSLTDPPYEIGFMGKGWDKTGIAFNSEFWSEMYRVLMPGAYLLAFGSPRTCHRLTAAIEDAGFEIRDSLQWVFGTGFPKSKSCLKPGYEPIVLARKPSRRGLLLNIDECRTAPGEWVAAGGANFTQWRRMQGRTDVPVPPPQAPHNKGRYPTNIILDEESAASLGDKARFFYCPKASRKERDAGLEGFVPQPSYMVANGSKRTTQYHNPHPTVKPIALNEWLANLIKRPGRLLVPFSGVGSEMIGGLDAGWGEVVGIEREAEYIAIAEARIRHDAANWRLRTI